MLPVHSQVQNPSSRGGVPNSQKADEHIFSFHEDAWAPVLHRTFDLQEFGRVDTFLLVNQTKDVQRELHDVDTKHL